MGAAKKRAGNIFTKIVMNTEYANTPKKKIRIVVVINRGWILNGFV